ncbi:unnamed protein product [Adineta steineri]|uniref:G-protein coupled receptors family 1 profile domain-containing protein n=1 Tax=Adineta steineri TaxID=433720 RepID=A0A815EGZ4_9BILA|nr:unnamed protein product [Adineta steineri]CAF3590776.1 unnamed protein product [Adineta steineri]
MQVNRYLGIFIFVFGIIGNTLNVSVLSQRPLCLNPCAWLFLISSIANSIGILAGVMSRVLSTWALDLTNTNQFLCKIRAFLLFNGITIGGWLIALATVDRWLSSNMNAIRRRQSTLKNAQRSTVAVIILSTIIQTQQLYCFEANLTNTPLKCYTQTIVCGIISDVCFALVTILCPIIFMLIFGLMTISNVRKTQSRLQPATLTMNPRNGHESTITNMRSSLQRKKSDRQLLIMLFIQVLLILLLTLPLATYKLYSTLTRNILKSTLQNTIENFIFNIFLLAVYVSCGMPFYIYTLSGGSVFRKALFSLMEALRGKMMHILH